MTSEYSRLKAKQRADRDQYHPNASIRIHRALSWLQRAEQCDDEDGRFVFLWIAFNAAYANEVSEEYRLSEQQAFAQFIERLLGYDSAKNLYNLVWAEFTNSIRALLNNRYVFQPFWDFHNQKIAEHEWQERFDQAKKSASVALGNQDTHRVLGIILSRLYTLRNQVIHGGATCGSSVNRQQLTDANKIMAKLVPIIIELLMDHASGHWGDACYPVLSEM
jgi:hypothetical protein